jgi:Imm-5 like putative immunity protein
MLRSIFKPKILCSVELLMRRAKQEKIKPAALLYDVRRSVSEILDKPFTERIDHQIFKPDQKVLALWAADCAERALPYFEDKYPNDDRPRKAIETLREWISTGVFSMTVIRRASLSAHASAKGKKEADAVFAAHAAGQAVGTAHVPTHALGSSIYSIRAVASHSGNVDDGLIKERNWQLRRLREYVKRSNEK